MSSNLPGDLLVYFSSPATIRKIMGRTSARTNERKTIASKSEVRSSAIKGKKMFEPAQNILQPDIRVFNPKKCKRKEREREREKRKIANKYAFKLVPSPV